MKLIAKNIFLLSFLIFFLTGCSFKNFFFEPVGLRPDFQDFNLSVGIDESDVKYAFINYRFAYSTRFFYNYTNLSRKHERELKNFFSKYFENVGVSKENTTDIFIKSEILTCDIDYDFFMEYLDLFLKIKIDIYKGEEEIFSKIYSDNYGKFLFPRFYRFYFYDSFDDVFRYASKRIYEKKLKPDLKKVLEDNF